MSTLQRILGGAGFVVGIEDAAARDTILSGVIGVQEAGGTAGFLPAPPPPVLSGQFSRILGGGLWSIGIDEQAKFQRMVGASIGIDEAGALETHSSAETGAYPKIIFY